MAKKTVMRRHAKTLPMSGDVLIDVEGRELERGASAAFALGVRARRARAPDRRDGRRAVRRRDRRGRDEGTEPERRQSAGEGRRPLAHPTSPSTTRPPRTRQRAEQMAEEILEALSKAKNLPELKAAYDGNQLELAGLPEDLAETVEGGYERNLKRLGSTRIKIARQVAEAQAELAK
jgi:recombination protein RecT